MRTSHVVALLLLLLLLARLQGSKAGYSCTLFTEYASRCYEPKDAITVVFKESIKNGICFAPRIKKCRLTLTRRRKNCQRIICSTSESYSIRVKNAIERLKPQQHFNPGVSIVYPALSRLPFREKMVLTNPEALAVREEEKETERQGEKKQEKKNEKQGRWVAPFVPPSSSPSSIFALLKHPRQNGRKPLPPPLPPPPPPPPPPFSKEMPKGDRDMPENYGFEENSKTRFACFIVCRVITACFPV